MFNKLIFNIHSIIFLFNAFLSISFFKNIILLFFYQWFIFLFNSKQQKKYAISLFIINDLL